MNTECCGRFKIHLCSFIIFVIIVKINGEFFMCDKCGKDITGNFIEFNIGTGMLDEEKCSIDIPDGHSLDLFITLTSHSDRNNSYDSVDLVDSFKPYTNSWSKQKVRSFCSKECLIEWFKDQLSNLPNP
jgi:hypothetical protein